MKNNPGLFGLYLLLGATASLAQDYPIQATGFRSVRVTGGFWAARQEVNRKVTIPFAFQQCEDSKRLNNFDLAAETLHRRAAGEKSFQNSPATIYPFDDSDVYKAVEAAAYELAVHPDSELQHRVDQWIRKVASAQEPDGYLYTFRTMHPDSPVHRWVGATRWQKDPESSHELYCAGHLFEAAVAHFEATGDRKLLDVGLRTAELLWRDFGDGNLHVAPGHQIVEMGLVKLYRATGDQRYVKLAKIFLDARGPGGPAYNQLHQLVVDQDVAVGHAVRANYMYSAMADVAALTGDRRYRDAVTKIWDNVAGRKLYLTGGVGALHKGEAYGADYELPNDAYNETCAAVSLMMWSHRMFLLTGDARYMDVFERTAYNGCISGVSLSGDRFFYPNPLVYDGQSKNNKGYAGRAPWFGCACCPPNLMRLLASLTGYFYAVQGDSVYANCYAESTARVTVAGTTTEIVQATDYPWDGRVVMTVLPEAPSEFALKLRIPGWASGKPVPSDLYTYEKPGSAGWRVTVNGSDIPGGLERGYAVIKREWHRGDVVTLTMTMPVQRVHGNPQIAALRGQVAFERGPLVYCVEDPERRLVFDALTVPANAVVGLTRRADLLDGAVALEITGALTGPDRVPQVTAIPYYCWDNRGAAPMAVWLRETP